MAMEVKNRVTTYHSSPKLNLSIAKMIILGHKELVALENWHTVQSYKHCLLDRNGFPLSFLSSIALNFIPQSTLSFQIHHNQQTLKHLFIILLLL